MIRIQLACLANGSSVLCIYRINSLPQNNVIKLLKYAYPESILLGFSLAIMWRHVDIEKSFDVSPEFSEI